MAEVQGRRVEEIIDIQREGDYCVRRSAGAIIAVWARLPGTAGNARIAAAGHGVGGEPEWEIVEHRDSTVTVSPSIDEGAGGYHGFLRAGVWERAS